MTLGFTSPSSWLHTKGWAGTGRKMPQKLVKVWLTLAP